MLGHPLQWGDAGLSQAGLPGTTVSELLSAPWHLLAESMVQGRVWPGGVPTPLLYCSGALVLGLSSLPSEVGVLRLLSPGIVGGSANGSRGHAQEMDVGQGGWPGRQPRRAKPVGVGSASGKGLWVPGRLLQGPVAEGGLLVPSLTPHRAPLPQCSKGVLRAGARRRG